VEEITYLFPQMSLKSIMAKILKVLNLVEKAEKRTIIIKGDLKRQIIVAVNVAKLAVQKLRCHEGTWTKQI